MTSNKSNTTNPFRSINIVRLIYLGFSTRNKYSNRFLHIFCLYGTNVGFRFFIYIKNLFLGCVSSIDDQPIKFDVHIYRTLGTFNVNFFKRKEELSSAMNNSQRKAILLQDIITYNVIFRTSKENIILLVE